MLPDPRLDAILSLVTRPARYTGHEWNSVRQDWEAARVHIALAYPDIYEVGMSSLGHLILYDLLNRVPGVLCERVYAPWVDMADQLRQRNLPLFSLESHRPLREFDIIGFSLPYELNYTNVLEMLDLAGIPPLTARRGPEDPLVIAGGTCAYNPEPLADFFDLFVIGEGEEVAVDLVQAYWDAGLGPAALGRRRPHRRDYLQRAAGIDGVYVPSFYRVSYHADGRVAAVVPATPEARPVVTKRIVPTLPRAISRPVVPYVEAVHDRAMVEIQRGCTRGCRFCQAGTIYRPVRERSKEEVLSTVEELLANTGYDEVALVSLSSTDHSDIEGIVSSLVQRYRKDVLSISLPSLRVDAFSVRLAEMLSQGKRPGLTFAPEAGTQRLRDVINKNVTADDLAATAQAAFGRGWHSLKLYFMVGLPTESQEDVQGIVDLVLNVCEIGRREQGGRARVNVSVATFVPKAQTAFQWSAQDRSESLEAKLSILQRGLRHRGVHLSWHDPQTSLLEAVLSRGDRRLGPAIYRAWQLGARFDAWSDQFNFGIWQRAFEEQGLDPAFYAHRERDLQETLPWDHIDAGVDRECLQEEYRKALRGEVTLDCREGGCYSCGSRTRYGVC